jgi:TonB family protein
LCFSNLQEDLNSMKHFRVQNCPGLSAKVGKKLLQGAALALILALALPARAADERAVMSRVTPIYPEVAKRMKIRGAVKLVATVDAQGKVTDVKEVSGTHLLAEAAEDAVRQWKFAPGPEESSVNVEIDFGAPQ